NTAYYNISTGVWSAGPHEPVLNGATQLVATDDPGVILPNGHILIALSPQGGLDKDEKYTFPTPSYIYEFDPTDNSFTDVSPGGPTGGETLTPNAFELNMLLLPSGQVLLGNEKTGTFQVWTPSDGVPDDSWRPVDNNIATTGTPGTYILTGQ